LQEVLDIIVEKLLILLNLTICGISLLDGEENMLRFSAAKSIEPLKEQDINLFQYPLDRLGGEFAGRLTQEMEYLKFDGPSFVVSPVTPLLKSLKSIYLFPLVARDNFTGVLTLAKNAPMFFSQDEVELLHAICNGAAIAIENARLYENLRRDEEIHKELLHRVVTVQEDERRRLAVELHDGIIQNLVSALYRQQFCLARLQEAPREVISAMEEVRQIIDATIMEMRRVIEGLRPAMLDDLGLYKAIEVYTKSLETKYPIRIELELEEPQLSLKPEAENAIFRILQEGLNNMVKHSHCERGRVCLRNDNGVLELQMSDDGLGFDVESIRTKAPQSYGLLGMQERVDYLGGELRISSRPGEGTLITVRVPLEKIVREN
jgi:signal transduction histidine kinase